MIQLLLKDKAILKASKENLKELNKNKKEFLEHFNFDTILKWNINFFDYECFTSTKNRCYVYNLFTLNQSQKNLLNNFIDIFKESNKIKVMHGASQYAPEQKKIMLVFISKANLKRKFLKSELNKNILELKASIKASEEAFNEK